MSAEIIVFLTFGLYMNRKFKEIKTEYENKFTQVNQKLDETNKKCDILFQMIQDIQQPSSLMQPPSTFGLKRRRKIVSNVLPDDYEEPLPPQPQKVQKTPHPETQQTPPPNPKPQTSPQSKNVEMQQPQPFDLLSNIINIIEIAKPAPQPKSETKIEVIDENEEKEMDDEIQEELDSLLEEDNEDDN